MSKYQIALIGSYAGIIDRLKKQFAVHFNDLGILQNQIAIFEESQLENIDPKGPLVAIFVGYKGASDKLHPSLHHLIQNSNIIIPCVSELDDVSNYLPEKLRHINAFKLQNHNSDIERLVTLTLENLRLLRRERRIFISYKRSESQSIAIQLYELLDKYGFDVFLDTRSVPYAVDFQSILWHRMADSDIILLLDTPKFRESHWTQLELSQANATSIQILHLLWPKVKPDDSSAFSEFVTLKSSDFSGRARTGAHANLKSDTAESIVARAEALRARALSARHRSLVDNFCDRAREKDAKYVAVQPERFISVQLANNTRIAVVPTIGVPRADRYQQIEKSIQDADTSFENIWLLYDERGILHDWLEHLSWLDNYLPVISVQVSKCDDRLEGSVK